MCRCGLGSVTFQVLTATCKDLVVLWDAAPYCLSVDLSDDGGSKLSEAAVSLCLIIRRIIPEHSRLGMDSSGSG
jgi:hypothetical protein